MKCKKTNIKPARIATLAAEAISLAGPISGNQSRIFAVAAKCWSLLVLWLATAQGYTSCRSG